MNKLKPTLWLFVSLACFAYPAAQAAQSVKPTTALVFADPLATIPVNFTYSVTSPDTESAAGLGLRVHFNSNALELISQTPYASQLQPTGAVSDDTLNLDSDPNTDKYWILAWVDLNTAWPGSGKTPLSLLSSSFKAKAGLTSSSAIRLTSSATSKNTSFQTSPLVICAKPTVSISSTDALANEKDANTASFTISLAAPLPTECGSLTINYNIAGTATNGTDYTSLSTNVSIAAGTQSAQVLVTPLSDSVTESLETVTLSLASNANYQLASPSQTTINIQDGSANTLPSVLITSAKLQVLEGTDSSVQITIARQSSDLSKPLTVYLSTAGTASIASDYQALPSSVTIPAGQTKTSFVVTLLNDTAQETNENLKISLQSNAAYQLSDLASIDLLLLDDESRANTDLALGQNAAQSIPTLSSQMLILLSIFITFLAFNHKALHKRLQGFKA